MSKLHRIHNFRVERKTVKREFGKDQGRIYADLEGTLIPLDKLDTYVIAKGCLQLCP